MALETSLMGGVNAFNSGIEGAIGNIQAADKQKTLGLLGQKLQGGDYDGAAQIAFSSGDANTGLKLLELKQTKAQDQANMSALGSWGGGTPAVPQAPVAAPQAATPMGPLGSSANAIRSIESGSGQGNYAAIGPVTRDGDRAYGAYQVMGKNVGPWTQQVLGRAMTPQEFAADPKAQDAVFNTIFGGYQQKYGPEGAARAWFGGPGAVKGRDNVADVNGMTVAQYGQKFSRLAGGQPAPTQVAALAPTTATDGVEGPLPPQITSPAAVPPKAVPADDAKKLAIRQRIDEGQQKLMLPGLKDGQRAFITAKLATLQKDLADLDKEKFTTLDKSEYAANGIDPNYKGVVQKNVNGAITFPGKASTEVNVENKGEGELSKTLGKGLGERINDIAKEGDAARTDLAMVGQLRDLGAVVKTGAPAAIQGWLANYGIKVGENVGAVEAYGSIVDKLTPNQRVPGSGSSSDVDVKMFKSSLPRLMNTPGGNEIIENTLAGLAQYKLERAAIADRVQAGELAAKDGIKAMRDLPNPYDNFKKFAKTGFKADPNNPASATPPTAKPAAKFTAPEIDQSLANARAAIAANPGIRDAVIKKLRDNGLPADGL